MFVQSFETANLRALDPQLRVPLVQLLDAPNLRPYDVVAAGGTTTYGDLATAAGLRGVAEYAAGVGPAKTYIVPRNADGSSRHADDASSADAHAAGLQVHPYTFRNENNFLPLELRRGTDPAAYGDAFAEYAQFFALGRRRRVLRQPGHGARRARRG